MRNLPNHDHADYDIPAVRLSQVQTARTMLGETLDALARVDPGAYALMLSELLKDIGGRLPDGTDDPRDSNLLVTPAEDETSMTKRKERP